MTWKDAIKKEDKMRFIGRLNNRDHRRIAQVSGYQRRFDQILTKGEKRRHGFRMNELEELLRLAEKINTAAPKQLAWIKGNIKEHQ